MSLAIIDFIFPAGIRSRLIDPDTVSEPSRGLRPPGIHPDPGPTDNTTADYTNQQVQKS